MNKSSLKRKHLISGLVVLSEIPENINNNFRCFTRGQELYYHSRTNVGGFCSAMFHSVEDAIKQGEVPERETEHSRENRG